MIWPTLTLDDDQEIALIDVPTDALLSFVRGNFDLAQTGPSDNPLVAHAIAKHLIRERELRLAR